MDGKQGREEITTQVGSHEMWNTPLVQNSPLAVVRDEGAVGNPPQTLRSGLAGRIPGA